MKNTKMSTGKAKVCNFTQNRQLHFYAKLTNTNKVSKERKTHKYDCAKGANAYKNISTERTNQGARAPLDRESAPKKRKKNLESTK